MKLIAETQQESRLVDGLSALLSDLGVEVDGYRKDEAVAVTFFSANQFAMPEELLDMSADEQSAFLCSIEDAMRGAMLAAGYRTINKALRHAKRGISHPDRHLS